MKNDVEPVVGAIEGYRWFKVEGGNELWSIGLGDHLWTPGANRARCHLAGKASGKTRTVWVNDPDDPDGIVKQREKRAAGHGRIPATHCQCGFWVLREEPPVDEEMGDVLGKVLIWGRAVQHRDGYRAEYAAIAALITTQPEQFASVLRAYRISTVRPRTKAEQGITTAYLTVVDGGRVKLDVPVRDTAEIIGWFTVAPGVEVPEPVAHLTARFTSDRIITEIRVHDDGER